MNWKAVAIILGISVPVPFVVLFVVREAGGRIGPLAILGSLAVWLGIALACSLLVTPDLPARLDRV